VSERESEIVLLPLNAIRPAPFNMTLMQPHEEEMLREEMRLESKGLEKIDPILVRRLTAEEIEKTKDKYPYAKYEIVDGHTRFRIAQELNWTSIKARVIVATWDQALDMAYRKNKERGTIDPLKEAQYFKYLVQDKKTPPYEVAEQFQMKVEDVQRILAKAIPNRGTQNHIGIRNVQVRQTDSRQNPRNNSRRSYGKAADPSESSGRRKA
jgi:ParB-like chromosome segregation protein Spo0J